LEERHTSRDTLVSHSNGPEKRLTPEEFVDLIAYLAAQR
jgi:hypothetical protein